jgi:hypothetical protein
MGRTRAPHTHCRLERDEAGLGGGGLGDAWGQHGSNPKYCQPGFVPCSLALGPVLRGPDSDMRWDDDKMLDGDDDCITEYPSATVTETTCGQLQPIRSLRSSSRQAMNVPYDTMVSFTGDFELISKRPILTRAGEESAHIYMAVLLLWERVDSVQRRWMP